MFNFDQLLRSNIRALVPYSSARSEYKGSTGTFLDANESAFGSPLQKNFNRYPDPVQLKLKEKLGVRRGVPVEQIFLGNGSDEAIDLLIRMVCQPQVDSIIVCPPTYGMYEVAARINDVKVVKINLTAETFQLNTPAILAALNKETKLVFVCCPNNPTGNGVRWSDIRILLEAFRGLVVVDEAYIDFAGYRSLIPELINFPNLVILQTFSKAWGLAGLRIGMAFASAEIIGVMTRIKPPYNIGSSSQELGLKALEKAEMVEDWVKTIVSERKRVSLLLEAFNFVERVYPSEANFILVKMIDPGDVYTHLLGRKIIVRDRSKVELCSGCLRITIGTKSENDSLIEAFKAY